jgi:hypothetical protein
MPPEVLPDARRTRLLVHEVGDELVVYDRERHRAHRLNRAAGTVWRRCDGRTSVRELAVALATELAVPVNEDVVRLALAQLERARLLRDPVGEPVPGPAISRRQVVRRLGAAGGLALLLPAVTSITAPTPVMAQYQPAGGVCTPQQGENCCQIGPTLCAGGISLLQCQTRGGTFLENHTCPS